MRKIFTTVKQFVAILVFMRALVACSSEDLYLGEDAAAPLTKVLSDEANITEIYTDSTKNGAIVLSNVPAGNPYNVDTLKKAFAMLYPNSRAAMPGFAPTHYQVRFLPADTLEFEALKNSDLIVTPIPLDKRVVDEGTYYFDPVLKAQGVPFTWQYTIVPVTQILPDIRYEVTAQICAPNDGTLRSGGNASVWPALEEKAFEMCGETPPPRIRSLAAGDVGMPGNIQLQRVFVWDSKANRYIPAKGAKLVFWNHLGVEDILVDEKGAYTYSGAAYSRLELHWDSKEKWVIYDGDESCEAVYALPQLSKGVWTINIKGGKQETFAHITRTLHRFYNEYNQGLHIPPVGPKERLNVVCVDGYDDNRAGLYSPPKKITVWAGEPGARNGGDELFSTMAHELGHSIHHRNIILSTRDWNSTDDILHESWARFVEWLLMEYEYNELSRILNLSNTLTFKDKVTLPYWLSSGAPGQPFTKVYTEYNYGYQYWPFGGTEPGVKTVDKKLLPYSPLFIDLADADNQQDYYRSVGIRDGWGYASYKYYPDDQVSGYTVSQLMGALRYSESLPEFRDHIKNSRPHTEDERAKLGILFDSYIRLWEGYK